MDSGIGFYYKIIKVKDKEHLRLDYSMYFYKTYEEALEAGLKEAMFWREVILELDNVEPKQE